MMMDMYTAWANDMFIKHRTTSNAMSKRNKEKIIDYLKNGETVLENMEKEKKASFKHKVKTKQYQILTSMGRESLAVPKKHRENVLLTVVAIEDFFQTIKKEHEATKHGGVNIVEREVHRKYYGIPRKAISKYISLCTTCQSKNQQRSYTANRQPASKNVFERMQVELIDMTSQESDGYKWILHCQDYLSKFNFLTPLKSHEQEVTQSLESIFALTGVPKSLQIDKRFTHQSLQIVMNQWPGEHRLICDSPHSRGLKVNGDKTVAEIIQKHIRNFQGDGPAPWSKWIPSMAYMLNAEHNGTIEMSPYERVYGIKPRPSPLIPGLQSNATVKEEAISVHHTEDIRTTNLDQNIIVIICNDQTT